MRALFCLCLTLLVVSPAHAELRDLRARVSGQEGLIWIGFDSQPNSVRSQAAASGLDLVIGGVSVSAHNIVPRDRELVAALAVEPTATGARLHLTGPHAWSMTEVELRQGGVLVRVHLGGAAAMTGDYPVVAPDWTPTPVPAPAPASTPAAPAHTEPAQSQPAHAAAPATPAAPVAATPDQAASEPAATPRNEPAAASPARASAVSARAASTAAAALPGDVTACAAAAAAVEANPWDDGRLLQHAACLAGAGNADAAGRIYEQILAFEPDDTDAALALADLRLQQGNRAAARALYLRAAEHANTDSEALRARSQAEALRPQ